MQSAAAQPFSACGAPLLCFEDGVQIRCSQKPVVSGKIPKKEILPIEINNVLDTNMETWIEPISML
jgi:hypothetical protein